jgi:glucokinase
MAKCCFGVDVGGTTVKIGCFDQEGHILSKWEIPTRKEEKGKYVLPDVAASLKNYIEKEHIAMGDIRGIGIGVPGPVLRNGTVERCVNLGWGHTDMKGILRQYFPGIDIEAGNDANVAALGEVWRGAGRGRKNAVMVTLGTGVGGGVIINGKIVTGVHGMGGEIGHITVNRDETETCGCGRKGCLEQYSSASGIVRLYKKECEKAGVEPLELTGPTDTLTIFNAARKGDEQAKAAIKQMADYLGFALAQMSVIIDPQAYLIGGGVSGGFDLFADDLRASYRKYCLAPSVSCRILPASLGNDAAMYGSAFQALLQQEQ